MYDWELSKYLQEKNNILDKDEYLYVCSSCPQLRQIKSVGQNNFEAISDSREHFNFQVFYKKGAIQ